MIDLEVMGRTLNALNDYVEDYEEQFADIDPAKRKMEVEEYQTKLLEFLCKSGWRTFDPVESGLVRYEGDKEWTPAYQLGLD